METIDLIVEVMGCPADCGHCWAQDTPYPAMPLTDAEWVVDAVHSWCDANDLRFGAYPMHEVAAHPQAADLWSTTEWSGGRVPLWRRALASNVFTRGWYRQQWADLESWAEREWVRRAVTRDRPPER